jgi:hypothetical protein
MKKQTLAIIRLEGLRKVALVLIAVMVLLTVVYVAYAAYTLNDDSEYPSVLYAYSAVLCEETPEKWYEPEQLYMLLTEINSTVLYGVAPSNSLNGYIIKYKDRFYQIVEPIPPPAGDWGIYGPNAFLKDGAYQRFWDNLMFQKKLAMPTAGLTSGWIATGIIGFIVFKAGRREA